MTLLRRCNCELPSCPHPRFSPDEPACKNRAEGAERFCQDCKENRLAELIAMKRTRELDSKQPSCKAAMSRGVTAPRLNPRKAARRGIPAVLTRIKDLRRKPMPPKEKVNILMVADQPAQLSSYEAMLGELDENLIQATSGKEALEHLLKNDVAVVLMDVSMPQHGGF